MKKVYNDTQAAWQSAYAKDMEAITKDFRTLKEDFDIVKSRLTRNQKRFNSQREDLNEHSARLEYLEDEWACLETASQLVNEGLVEVRRGMCQCTGRPAPLVLEPEEEEAVLESFRSDSALSYLTAPIVTAPSPELTPPENASPIPIPEPMIVEGSEELQDSDQENVGSSQAAEDAEDLLEEEENARRFGRRPRTLETVRERQEVIRRMAPGRKTLGRVLPAPKRRAHPYSRPTELVKREPLSDIRTGAGLRRSGRGWVLRPFPRCRLFGGKCPGCLDCSGSDWIEFPVNRDLHAGGSSSTTSRANEVDRDEFSDGPWREASHEWCCGP